VAAVSLHLQQGAGGNGLKSAIEEGGEEEAKIGMQERLAMPPTSGEILQNVLQGKPTGDVTDHGCNYCSSCCPLPDLRLML
jgi:hypothetical protein